MTSRLDRDHFTPPSPETGRVACGTAAVPHGSFQVAQNRDDLLALTPHLEVKMLRRYGQCDCLYGA